MSNNFKFKLIMLHKQRLLFKNIVISKTTLTDKYQLRIININKSRNNK